MPTTEHLLYTTGATHTIPDGGLGEIPSSQIKCETDKPSSITHPVALLPTPQVRSEPNNNFLTLVSDGTFDSSEKAEEHGQNTHQSDGSHDQPTTGKGEHTEKKLFIWEEDLSENGRKLYWLLLGDVGFIEYLPELTQHRQIDLDSGLQELREHNVLDESVPQMYRIRF
ncbi:MAG: hypothetical protein U0350_48755 [Caldilineaceae bacterium]